MSITPLIFFLILQLFLLGIAIFLVSTGITIFFGAPYLPTLPAVARKMLELGELKEGETVLDLGSGDGSILIVAAKEFGAHGIGYEINPFLRILSRWRIRRSGLADKIKSYPRADLIVIFLLDGACAKLSKRFQVELPPGTRVVSHGFSLPDWPKSATVHRTSSNLYAYVQRSDN